jgi:DNA polymerase (family 10)
MSRQMADTYIHALRQIFGKASTYPCGSYRRKAETIGDLDVAVVASATTWRELTSITAEMLDAEITRSGNRLAVLVTPQDHQIDLYRVYDHKEIGAMRLFLTGSHKHNIKMRTRAKFKGFVLNQYGLRNRETNQLVSTTEHGIFAALDFPYKPPQAR